MYSIKRENQARILANRFCSGVSSGEDITFIDDSQIRLRRTRNRLGVVSGFKVVSVVSLDGLLSQNSSLLAATRLDSAFAWDERPRGHPN